MRPAVLLAQGEPRQVVELLTAAVERTDVANIERDNLVLAQASGESQISDDIGSMTGRMLAAHTRHLPDFDIS